MSDHPVMIPTSQGPVGGIVSEPDGDRRAALILLQGGGRGGRAGYNACWTRVARDLADMGVVVLRFDYWKEGDSSLISERRHRGGRGPHGGGDRDLSLLREVAPWFRDRVPGLELLVFGSCYGGRLAVELAGELADVAATFLVVPYLRVPEQRLPWRDRLNRMLRGKAQPGPEEPLGPEILDPVAVDAVRSALARAPCLVMTGERDPGDVFVLERLLVGADGRLDVEVVPDKALYPVNYPDIQEIVSDRLEAWVAERLGRAQPARG